MGLGETHIETKPQTKNICRERHQARKNTKKKKKKAKKQTQGDIEEKT